MIHLTSGSDANARASNSSGLKTAASQPHIRNYTAAMSRAELIEIVDRTSPEDRLFLNAYIEHRVRADDPENGPELDRRLERMRAGQEVSLNDARKLHEELAARGM